MTILLVSLLASAIGGLTFLGLYAFQLRTTVSRLKAAYDTDIRQLTETAASSKAQYQGVVSKYNEEVRKWGEAIKALRAENQQLSKWKHIPDAEAKATELVRRAQAKLDGASDEAFRLISGAQQQASAVQAEAEAKAQADLANARQRCNALAAEAKERAKNLKSEAEVMLSSATARAAAMIDAANRRAEEIAGSAYDALRNASQYQQTVKAMRNIIEGYGDQYLIPEQSLLDDLADDYSHAQAGQDLKQARDLTKMMIKNGTAADCDYVEANRRETAINFVIDAFNGKVDSIMSRVKHDNAGTLAQQIRDAFTLVNYNGKPFRDARIKEEYLAARLNELKWAEVTQQLALREREEQRYAKEQAREEARALKEQERALREAAKEEAMLQKALQQAQEQFDHATGEQKAMYELRLQEMADRLKQALERKERARSMAEQTKKGHVYIISSVGSFGEDVYKLGLTRRDDPFDRIRELGDSSVPFDFDVHAMILSDDAPALEHRLHKHFLLKQMNKVDHRKEFFRVSLQEVREEIEKLGLTTGVKWTMTAEAREYRETLAIEEAIRNDPEKREAWVRRQLYLDLKSLDDDVEGIPAEHEAATA